MNQFEHGLLTYLSEKQLSKIQQTKIGIAGAGGLGSNIANILVRTGFKNFEIIDSDIIEASNLNRQNYFLEEIGQAKAEITAKRLWQINPSVRVKIARTYLDKTNIANYFANCQIIFEAFDNVESKKMFLEHFLHSEKLVIFGNGMAGTNPIAELKITKLKENIILVGDNITNVNTQNPPLAPRVIACAAIMADVALQYILKRITNESIL